jgi:hypothetical protein
LIVDIEHIGEQPMTHTSSRSLSLLLAAAFAVGLWLPTLSVPPAHAEAAHAGIGAAALPELA